MKQYQVRFWSSGLMFSEESKRDIPEPDVELARAMIKDFLRKPYAFEFITFESVEGSVFPKITHTSPRHYLQGEVLTLAQVKAEKDPRNDILIGNMEGNGFKRIIRVNGSTLPFEDDAVML